MYLKVWLEQMLIDKQTKYTALFKSILENIMVGEMSVIQVIKNVNEGLA